MMETKEKEEPVHLVYYFKCSSCGLHEKAQYKGKNPPFSRNILLKHPSYVMKDPFSPPGKGEILLLGADCSLCEKQFCISRDCSLFYNKTFCLACAQKRIEIFPVEIQNRLSLKKK